jgi:predicted DNA-binding transcriptional regulator AlpA
MATEQLGEALWTVHDVAAFLHVSESWVYTEAAARRLPCRKLRGHVRFVPSEVRAYIDGAKPTIGRVWAMTGDGLP